MIRRLFGRAERTDMRRHVVSAANFCNLDSLVDVLRNYPDAKDLQQRLIDWLHKGEFTDPERPTTNAIFLTCLMETWPPNASFRSTSVALRAHFGKQVSSSGRYSVLKRKRNRDDFCDEVGGLKPAHPLRRNVECLADLR